MRTKTLLLTAALSAAAIATSVAQTVYSVNAVGYVNVPVPAGKFALLSNPLNQATNSLTAVLPDVPNGTKIFVYAGTNGFQDATKRSATSWSGPFAQAPYNGILNPGQGFFIQNLSAADFTVTFVGEVPQGTNLTVAIPAGFSLIGSPVPQSGKVETDLKLPAASGDKMFQYDPTAGYNKQSTRRGVATWTGVAGQTEPTIGVAEAFFYQAAAASTWARNFSVNQ